MERQKFEDSWKESFKDTEVSPSENLWTNIELDLERAEGKTMKRRVLFFKLLAAASITFAMAIAGTGLYYYQQNENVSLAQRNVSSGDNQNQAEPAEGSQSSGDPLTNSQSENSAQDQNNVTAPSGEPAVNTEKQLAENSTENRSTSEKNEDAKAGITKESLSGNSQHIKSDVRVKNTRTNNHASDLKKGNRPGNSKEINTGNTPPANVLADNGNRSSAEASEYNLTTTKGELPRIVRINAPALNVPAKSEVADPVATMMARLNETEKKYQEEEKEEKSKKNSTDENIWTSVGFAAGSFNTMASGNVNPQLPQTTNSFLVSNAIIHDQSTASGSAYSIGLSLGGKIARRWVLQGGVNYLTQSSDYTTNAVVGSADYASFKVASINEIDKMSSEAGKADSRLLNTASYGVNSSLQYISVPLQAGYLIINKDFGWQFNAGLSTDLFLQNTLTPDGGTLEKTTQGRGDDSPYRSVNFSGLVGTEVSYRFGQHYRVAVNPGLRYPFSSIYKSDISVSAIPLTFDVGLKFRYIFN